MKEAVSEQVHSEGNFDLNADEILLKLNEVHKLIHTVVT